MRAKFEILRYTFSALTLLLLAGCVSSPALRSDRLEYGGLDTSSTRAAVSFLEFARSEFDRGNYGNAIGYLEKELARRPASIAALNGLGACYDMLGRFDISQRYYFRALDLAPDSSLTLSNLGYSYLKQNRSREAAAMLKLSLEKDGSNLVAARNLSLALAAVPQQAPDVSIEQLVRGSTDHEPTDPGLSVDTSHRRPDHANGLLSSEEEPDELVASTALDSPQLRLTILDAPQLKPKWDSDLLPHLATLSEPISLVVQNGNGVRGIARATADWLEGDKLQIRKIQDAENYDYLQSVIYYRPELALHAQALAASLNLSCQLVPSEDLTSGADVKLVLGHDFASQVRLESGDLRFDPIPNKDYLLASARVEVVNGNGEHGTAAALRDYLIEKGTSVVNISDSERFDHEESRLYFRKGMRTAAQAIAASLPMDRVRLVETTDLSRNLDARLLVGLDFLAVDRRALSRLSGKF